MWYFSNLADTLDFRAEINQDYDLSVAKQAIEHIENNFPSPYHLMVSGGVDSQAMLYVWNIFSKKKFYATSVIYDKNIFFNRHDLYCIEKVAKEWNISINFLEFDILKFYQKRYFEVADEFECSSPQISTHIEMSRNLPGTVIFSGNWITMMTYNKVQHALTLYSKTRSCIPFFFLSQPDIAYTGFHIRRKIQSKLDLNKPNEEWSAEKAYKNKINEYHLAGYPVLSQNKKYTGFEEIKNYYDNVIWRNLSAKEKIFYLNNNNPRHTRAHDIMLRSPLEKKYGDKKFTILTNFNTD